MQELKKSSSHFCMLVLKCSNSSLDRSSSPVAFPHLRVFTSIVIPECWVARCGLCSLWGVSKFPVSLVSSCSLLCGLFYHLGRVGVQLSWDMVQWCALAVVHQGCEYAFFLLLRHGFVVLISSFQQSCHSILMSLISLSLSPEGFSLKGSVSSSSEYLLCC